jgi:hypothetical protein
MMSPTRTTLLTVPENPALTAELWRGSNTTETDFDVVEPFTTA